jgi:hypothetical protein
MRKPGWRGGCFGDRFSKSVGEAFWGILANFREETGFA